MKFAERPCRTASLKAQRLRPCQKLRSASPSHFACRPSQLRHIRLSAFVGQASDHRGRPNKSFKPTPLHGHNLSRYVACSIVAVQRRGLTQVLGIMQQDSIDRAPTASEVWVARALTLAMTLVFGYAAYYTFHAYFVRSARVLGFAAFLSCLCAVFLFFFLRSVLTKPGRPTKPLLLAVFSVLTVLGMLGLWLAYSVDWPDSIPIIGYAIGILGAGVGGLLAHGGRRDA